MNKELKTAFFAAAIFIGLAAFVYLLFAFGNAELNFTKWEASTRYMCSILFAALLFISVGVSVNKYYY